MQELYLRLCRADELAIADRHHFFSLAARVLRQILIDSARRQLAERRGAGERPASLEEGVEVMMPERPSQLVALDEALDRLASQDGELARLVELHFFAGLTFAEIAEAGDRSERTLRRDWRRARAFLSDQLRDLGGAPAVVVPGPVPERG